MKEIALPITNFAENAAMTASRVSPEMNTLCRGRKIVKRVAKNKQGVASASQ